jgi:hypothetical protein
MQVDANVLDDNLIDFAGDAEEVDKEDMAVAIMLLRMNLTMISMFRPQMKMRMMTLILIYSKVVNFF